MEIIKGEKSGHALDALYLRYLSLDPLKDRGEIEEHCEAVLSNTNATKFGDPNFFNIETINNYLFSERFPAKFRALYKQESLTSWDKLILATKRFVACFFYDKARTIRDNIQRYQDATDKIIENYGLDPNSLATKEGRQEFLSILDKELAVRVNWFIKYDKNHSVTAITPLSNLSKPCDSKRFFLNLLSTKKEHIQSYLKSEYRDSISSIYARLGEVPDMKKGEEFISIVTNYAENVLKIEPKILISAIASLMAGRGFPDPDQVIIFLNTIKDFCENGLHTTDPADIIHVIRSITSMQAGRGFPSPEQTVSFLKGITDFCKKKLGLTNASDIVNVISSITGMQNRKGFPENNNHLIFLKTIRNFCIKKLNVHDPKIIASIASSITGIQGTRGTPEIKMLLAYLNTINRFCRKSLKIEDPQIIVAMIRSLGGMLFHRGFSKDLNTFLKTIKTACEKDLLINDPLRIARIIRYFAWMRCSYGIPETMKIRSFIKLVKKLCIQKLDIEAPQKIASMISYIAWMQQYCDIPDSKKLNAYFDTLKICSDDTIKAKKIRGIRKLLDFVGNKRKSKGVFESYKELTELLKKSSKSLSDFGLSKIDYEDISFNDILQLPLEEKLPSAVRNQLNTKLFQFLYEQIPTLMAFRPLLERLWGIPEDLKRPHASYGNRRRTNLLCRYYTKKIQDNPNIIRGCKELDKKSQDEIINAANNYILCYATLIRLNKGLVIYYVSKHKLHHSSSQDSLKELKHIGMIGLTKAIDNFELEQGFHFSSYAEQPIIFTILNEKAENNALSEHFTKNAKNINTLRKKRITMQTVEDKIVLQRNETGGTPLEEIKLQSLSSDEIKIISKMFNMSEHNVKRAIEPPVFISLSSPHGDDGDELEFASDSSSNPFELAALKDVQNEQNNFMGSLLNNLDERERIVINQFFGFSQDGQRKKLEEIGRELHPPITKHEVSQIKRGALEKLKTAIIGSGLEDKVEDLFFNKA